MLDKYNTELVNVYFGCSSGGKVAGGSEELRGFTTQRIGVGSLKMERFLEKKNALVFWLQGPWRNKHSFVLSSPQP